jgi:transposase
MEDADGAKRITEGAVNASPITAYKGRDAAQVVEAALAMYDEGKEIEEAAQELGVPARTIHRWLATNAVDRWQEAQKGRAVADYEATRKRRDEARATLESLKQTLDTEDVKDAAERNWRLAHAREVLRAADQELKHQEWLLERLVKRIYGQELQVTDAGRVSITLNIGAQQQPEKIVSNQ